MLDYMGDFTKNHRIFYKKSTFKSMQSKMADTLVPLLEVNVTTGPMLL